MHNEETKIVDQRFQLIAAALTGTATAAMEPALAAQRAIELADAAMCALDPTSMTADAAFRWSLNETKRLSDKGAKAHIQLQEAKVAAGRALVARVIAAARAAGYVVEEAEGRPPAWILVVPNSDHRLRIDVRADGPWMSQLEAEEAGDTTSAIAEIVFDAKSGAFVSTNGRPAESVLAAKIAERLVDIAKAAETRRR